MATRVIIIFLPVRCKKKITLRRKALANTKEKLSQDF
jgi:hypothetical protein